MLRHLKLKKDMGMKTHCAKIPCKGCPEMLLEAAALTSVFGLTIVAKLMPLIVN
jgi:hypothetical protein